MKASFYRNAHDSVGNIVDVAQILGGIKNGKWMDNILRLREVEDKDERQRLKELLPAITFSGTFEPTRSLGNCNCYNNLLVVDIDKLDYEKVEVLMKVLSENLHVMVAFRSPSGNGIKALIPVTSDLEHHYDAFECIRIYFETNYAISIDISGKDVCRLCYVSFDSRIHYNPGALPMQIDYRAEVRQKIYGDRDFSRKGLSVTNDDRVKYEVTTRWAEKYKPYEEGSRNSNLFLHACNMNRVGIALERAQILVIGHRTDMDVKEIQDTILKVYRNKQQEHNTITVYDFEVEQQARKDAFEHSGMDDLFDDILSTPMAPPVLTGDKRIDRILGGGLNPGCAYIFVGREGSYKSVLAQLLCQANAQAGIPSVYANGEMSKVQFMRTIIRQQLGVDIMKYRGTDGKIVLPEEIRTKVNDVLMKDLMMMRTVHDRDFNESNLVSTMEDVRKKTGKDVGLLVIDGANHMDARGKAEIPALIDNAKVIKEVAKKANEGRGVAVIVLIHTDASCKFWTRNPLVYIRGKGAVTRNFDAIFNFSRFIKPEGAFATGEDDFELLLSAFHLRVEDRRFTGEVIDVVCAIDNDLSVEFTDVDPAQYEVKIPSKQSRY
jgi:archaellum biogenesis ATPase FlaH